VHGDASCHAIVTALKSTQRGVGADWAVHAFMNVFPSQLKSVRALVTLPTVKFHFATPKELQKKLHTQHVFFILYKNLLFVKSR
jgi:hypothetical protein